MEYALYFISIANIPPDLSNFIAVLRPEGEDLLAVDVPEEDRAQRHGEQLRQRERPPDHLQPPGIMVLGVAIFQLFPGVLLGFFEASDNMLDIGVPALVHSRACWR